MMRTRRIIPLALVAVVLATVPAAAQTDTTNIPLPPTDRLARLEPFFGAWEHHDTYFAGLGPWNGTMTVGPAIKGWYVEFTILTKFGPIDRELRMLVTWDEDRSRYRVWRFETLPQDAPDAVEAEARFVGDEFVMEWKNTHGPDGTPGTFRNRIRLDGRDELVIISEAEPRGQPLITLSEWRSTRSKSR